MLPNNNRTMQELEFLDGHQTTTSRSPSVRKALQTADVRSAVTPAVTRSLAGGMIVGFLTPCSMPLMYVRSNPVLQSVLLPSRLSCYNKAPKALRPCGAIAYKMGLGRLELPTSRLSDISRALVGAGERWK